MSTRKLKIAYFGSPSFSAYFLEKLLTDKTLPIEVKLVITQEDKPVGRKQILTPSPVKQIATKYQISNIKYQKEIENWKLEIGKLDLALVLAFGKIIPKELLHQPKYGFWNIHYSLLPKYRGPSPTAYALIAGEKKTGVTIFQMDEEIDHGPIIAQEKLEILANDRRSDLEKRLTDLAFEMFRKTVIQLTSLRVNELKTKPTRQPVNPLTLKPQNHQQSTYTRLLKKEDGFVPLETLKKALKNEPLSFEELPKILKEYLLKYPLPFQTRSDQNGYNLKVKQKSGTIFYNLFRGLYPWPGVWTLICVNHHNNPRQSASINEKRLKITDLKYQEGKLTILKVQLEGKKEVDFETFNRAYKIF